AIRLGLVLGFAILARQQGFFVILAIVLYAAARAWTSAPARARIIRDVAVALFAAAVVGGWFYAGQKLRYGSALAYAKAPAAFSLASQPREFYLGLGGRDLFLDPVRPAFRNQLLPIFYSETWGDYQGYFLVAGRDARDGSLLSGPDFDALVPAKRHKRWLRTNRFEKAAYLGRVNLLALVPSALFVAGTVAALVALARGLRRGAVDALALPLLVVVVSFGAFVFLLLLYPSVSGNMIKATYLLPAFPMLALLGAACADGLSLRRPRIHALLLAALALVAPHGAGAYVTAYGPGATGGPAAQDPARARSAGKAPLGQVVERDPVERAAAGALPPALELGAQRGEVEAPV